MVMHACVCARSLVHSLSQVGSVPVHDMFARQILVAGPLSTKPGTHWYLTNDPTVLPLETNRPLAGDFTAGQYTMTIRGDEPLIDLSDKEST